MSECRNDSSTLRSILRGIPNGLAIFDCKQTISFYQREKGKFLFNSVKMTINTEC